MFIIFDPIGGMSGDMTLSAIINALPEKKNTLLDKIRSIPLDFELSYCERINEQNILCGTIEINHSENAEHRNLKDITKIISETDLAQKWKTRALDFFTMIAEVEASIHNTTPDKIHFHEIGAIDSIVDIIGFVTIMEHMDITEMFYLPPLPFGKGTINTQHGIIPSFAPASAKLLQGKKLKLTAEQSEMITPTGALFLHGASEMDTSFSPLYTGYGKGKRNFQTRPNLLRVFLSGENTETVEHIMELETNIDDMSPQSLSVLYKMIGTIALDVLITPVLMKKNRPGFKVTVLTQRSTLEDARNFIFKNTTTTGIRYSQKSRFVQKRIISQISTQYGTIHVKLLNSKVIPEFDDCLAASEKSGIPVYKIIEEVRNIASSKS